MFLLAVRAGNDPAVIFEGTAEALVSRLPAMEADVARWAEELQQALEADGLVDDEDDDAWADRPVLVRLDHEPVWRTSSSSRHEDDEPSSPELAPVVVFAGESAPFAWLAWLVAMGGASEGPSAWRPIVWAYRSEAHMLETQPEAGVNGAARRAWFERVGAWGAHQRAAACDLVDGIADEPNLVRGVFGHTLRLLAARIGEGFE